VPAPLGAIITNGSVGKAGVNQGNALDTAADALLTSLPVERPAAHPNPARRG